jgi:hypothetical protein
VYWRTNVRFVTTGRNRAPVTGIMVHAGGTKEATGVRAAGAATDAVGSPAGRGPARSAPVPSVPVVVDLTTVAAERRRLSYREAADLLQYRFGRMYNAGQFLAV